MSSSIERILVAVDFGPVTDAALAHALAIADACGAEVEVLHVWSPREGANAVTAIFADTPEGLAMEQLLSAADSMHSARVCGRLEFGGEPSAVILAVLERERFDLVVMGLEGDRCGTVADAAPCKVVTMPPPPDEPDEPDETEAA